MKIGLAQIQSKKGDISHNIAHHLKWVKQAIEAGVDFIVFPELSITGYEPTLAEQLATTADDEIFEPFQKLSDTSQISIGIGMPLRANDGITISMLLFQPKQKRLVYSKKRLHVDELPFFISGKQQPFLQIKNVKLALGICYETLQREHFVTAKENQADVFVASVAKKDQGTDSAYLHFPEMASEFQMPVVMANAIGFCDNFQCNGSSAVWNVNGEVIDQLSEQKEGLLVFDTETEVVFAVE